MKRDSAGQLVKPVRKELGGDVPDKKGDRVAEVAECQPMSLLKQRKNFCDITRSP